MEMLFAVAICVGLLGFFVGGFLGFNGTKSYLQDIVEITRQEDVLESEEKPQEPQPDYKAEVDRLRKLLTEATDNANRLSAMNEGLTEDLAALKAYNPEEIEERLKKIREIGAEEEREKRLENLERLGQEVSAQIALSMLNSGGFGSPASACCLLADQQRISWR